MDGYAVRLADANQAGAALRVVATAPAGHPFEGRVGHGEAVRIFTGGVVPDGADAIVIQENVDIRDERIVLRSPAEARHIRPACLDFRKGDVLARTGQRLAARDIALIAAGNVVRVDV